MPVAPAPRPTSPRTLVMLLAAASIVAASLALPTARLAVVSLGLGLSMLAIAAIDADRFIVPDVLSLPAIPVGLLASGRLVSPELSAWVALDNCLGAAAGWLILWAIARSYHSARGQAGLGFGDVKLAAAGGAWVGIAALAQVILLASLAALVVVGARAAQSGTPVDRHARVPFGAFLAPAIWIVWSLQQHGVLV